jgi:hypothetical protein
MALLGQFLYTPEILGPKYDYMDITFPFMMSYDSFSPTSTLFTTRQY